MGGGGERERKRETGNNIIRGLTERGINKRDRQTNNKIIRERDRQSLNEIIGQGEIEKEKE